MSDLLTRSIREGTTDLDILFGLDSCYYFPSRCNVVGLLNTCMHSRFGLGSLVEDDMVQVKTQGAFKVFTD